jgi:WD40 repeat protein
MDSARKRVEVRDDSYITEDKSTHSLLGRSLAQSLMQAVDYIIERKNWWEGLLQEETAAAFTQNLNMELDQRTDSIQGHLGSVMCIAIGEFGNLMITGSFDSCIRVWNLEQDRCVRVIKQHKGCVNTIIVCQSQGFFITAGSDSNIYYWSLEMLELIAKVESGHVNGISKMCMSIDTQMLWTAGSDGTAKLWTQSIPIDAIEGSVSKARIAQVVHRILASVVFKSSHTLVKTINDMILSPDEQNLYLANQDGTICKVASRGGKAPTSVEAHGKAIVRCLALTKDGTILISGGTDNKVRIWQVQTSKFTLINELSEPEGEVLRILLYSNDSYLVASCHTDIIIWDTKTWRVEKKIAKAHTSDIYSLAADENTGRLLSGSIDKTLKFWNMLNGWDCSKVIEGHFDSIRCIILSEDNQYLFSGGYDNVVKIWDLQLRKCLATLSGHQACITDIAHIPELKIILSSSKDGTVRIWNFTEKSQSCQAILTTDGQDGPSIYSMAALKNKMQLATAHKHQDIRLWDLNKKSLISTLKGHTAPVNVIKVSKNEKFLYSAGEDLEILIWEVRTAKILRRFGKEQHARPISTLEISPDSKFLVTGSEDKTIKVWSLDELTLIETFTEHKDTITSLKFSSSGNILFSSSLDGTFKLWDMQSYKSITSLGTTTIALNDMEVGKDENKVYLAAADSTIKIYNLNEDVSEDHLPGHEGKILSLIAKKDCVITSCEDKAIRQWEITEGTYLACRKNIRTQQIVYCMQEGRENVIYCGAEDSKVRTYLLDSIDSHNINNTSNFFSGQHEDIITSICISSDLETIYTASAKNDQKIKAWKVKSQQLEIEYLGMGSSVYKLVVNKENSILYAAGLNYVKTFDLNTGKERSTLKGHRGVVNDIVLSHSQSFLYSGGADQSIKCWNLADESVMETYKEHSDEVLALFCTESGAHLLSSGKDNFINIYFTIDGSLIFKMKTVDTNITCMHLNLKDKVMYAGGDKFLNVFNFSTYSSLFELDAISLESLKHYIHADTNAEKSKELINFVESLKLKGNQYYLHRVNPVMFLASLPFTKILRYALNTFKYPKFQFSYQDDLLYRTLVDEDKRNNHLNTVCEYLIDNPKEIYLHQKTMEEMMKFYNNIKIQKLLTELFNANVHGQEGSTLIVKGRLRRDPIMRPSNYMDTIPKSLNRSVIKDESKLEEISYRVSKFPMNIHNGTAFSLMFFRGLAKCQKDVILSDMKHVINCKWIKLLKVILVHALIFAILVALTTWYFVFQPDSTTLFAICIIMNILFILFSITCALGDFKNYIQRGFNWADALLFPFNIITLIINYLQIEYREIVVAVNIFCYMFRAITYLRVYGPTRYLVSMVLQVFVDMGSFLIITTFWVLMFTFILKALRGMDDEYDPARSDFIKVLLEVFQACLGQYNTDNYVWYDWVVFPFLTIMVTSAIFNLLIAIINNTYEEVRMNREYFDLREKLEIITDFDNFLSKIGFNKVKCEIFNYQMVAFHPEMEDTSERLAVGSILIPEPGNEDGRHS